MSRLLLIIVLFCSSSLYSQNHKLKGDIQSPENEGIPFASIVLSTTSDSSMVKATTSDINGGFVISGLSDGTYYLSISYVGYSRYNSEEIKIAGADINVGTISLSTSSVSLDAVTITAEKALIEVMPDKTVFNVKNVGGTAGLSGFELLRRSPGLVIDNNNNLIVEGKSGVQVWIDGKPSVLSGEDLTQYLRSIQASDIESIEIITQPSAKYDAQGNAGIINIKLKKDKRYGTNGSVSTGLAYWEFLKWNNSLSLNNRSRKANVFFTYSNRLAKSLNQMNFDQRIENQSYQERSRTVSEENSHHIKSGADFFLSPKSTVGILMNGSFNDAGATNNSRTTIEALANDATDALLEAQSIDQSDNQNLFFNANYRYEDTLGHSLNFDIDYGRYTSDRISDQPNFYFDDSGQQLLSSVIYQMKTPLEINILSSKIDYEQNLGKGKLGLGVKASQVNTNNSFSFFEEDSLNVLQFVAANTNDFDYSEQVLAAYVNYIIRKDKWGYQVGLRAENTQSLGELFSVQQTADDRVERTYLNLFPSGGVTYSMNQNNSWALNYSRRINRPNYEELNPFQYRLNELGYRQGNPFLRPNYSNNFKISHTYMYRFTTSLSYTHVDDFYAQVTDTVNNSGTFGDFIPSIIQARNVADEHVFSLSVSLPFDVNEWWSVYANISANRTEYRSEDPKFNALGITALNFYGQNSFKLPNDWRFEVSGWANTGGIWGGTFVTKGQGSLDLALSKKFFDQKLSTSLGLSDVFFTAPWQARGEFNGIPIDGDGSWESRLVRLNLSYNFGNQELKSRRERKTATEEERNRM